MKDDPAGATRRKRDSSVVRAAEAVRDGRMAAMVSAGNTGAAVASALLRMGRIRGVARPAIATTLPVPGSLPRVIRVLVHYYAAEDHRPRHVYLGEARSLRADLDSAQ